MPVMESSETDSLPQCSPGDGQAEKKTLKPEIHITNNC